MAEKKTVNSYISFFLLAESTRPCTTSPAKTMQEWQDFNEVPLSKQHWCLTSLFERK